MYHILGMEQDRERRKCLSYIDELYEKNKDDKGVIVIDRHTTLHDPKELSDFIVFQCGLHIENKGIRDFELEEFASDLCELEMENIDKTINELMDYISLFESPSPTFSLIKHLIKKGLKKIKDIITENRNKR